MPAFDPVRDAVLNSPVTPSTSLPFVPPSSSSSSPSLPRRATDLSVLLNSDSHQPTITLRTPPLQRPASGLARLLNEAPVDVQDNDDKLAAFEPLSRPSPLTHILRTAQPKCAFADLSQQPQCRFNS
ncbi:hypothetical protein ONZ45_g5279 [Pleurotus djamor]|nr:hypothetical protein ONZ45_g5279 [Pleurotus djamor]